MRQITLLGFGEVGQRLAADLRAQGDTALCVWDVLFDAPDSPPARAVFERVLCAAPSLAAAVQGADLVICAVTAGQAVQAAIDTAQHMAPMAWYLDLNSVSPHSRKAAAHAVETAGGRYVEAAVMSPIHPHGLAAPILLGGPHAAAFPAASLGLRNAQPFSSQIGTASAAKMCRSVVVKGLESLLTESLMAARHYGVEDTVLGSLTDLLPLADWQHTSHYLIARSVEHGARRAAEMREVAATIQEAGVAPIMSLGSASRQDWAAHRIPVAGSLTAQLDALLATR